MQFNQDKVRKITSEVLTSLERHEELKNLSLDVFLADHHKISSAKYNFIVAIEGIIDLCNHIIAKNAYRTPEDYADTFKVLEERGAFDAEFTNVLTRSWSASETVLSIFIGKSITTSSIKFFRPGWRI